MGIRIVWITCEKTSRRIAGVQSILETGIDSAEMDIWRRRLFFYDEKREMEFSVCVKMIRKQQIYYV